MFVVSNCDYRSVGCVLLRFDCAFIGLVWRVFVRMVARYYCVLLNSVGMIGFAEYLLVVVICFGLVCIWVCSLCLLHVEC